MNDDRCPRADEIVRAARRGVVDRDVERHLESCPECADEALVSAFFVEIEERQTAPTPLPDAAGIWRRAARAHRLEAATRATRIIAVWKWASIACGVVLALAGMLGVLVLIDRFVLAEY